MRKSAVLLTWALLLPVAQPAQAFSKFEHEQITYYAHEVVRHRACGQDDPPSLLCEAPIDSEQLATVARAVDYFSFPNRLAPWPDDCPVGKRFQCRKRS